MLALFPLLPLRHRQHRELASAQFVACCKSNETTKAKRYTEKSLSLVLTFLRTNENLMVQVG